MYLSDNDRRAQASYDAMLARGPQEDPVFSVTVDYTIWVDQSFTLEALRKEVGGEAHFSSDVDEDGLREVQGSTELEEITDEDHGEEVFRNHLEKIQGVDMEDPDITITGPDAEDDYDPRDEG